MNRPAAALLLMLSLSCARKECVEQTFAGQLESASQIIETDLMDLGTPEARQYLDSGWSVDERWGNENTFVWAVGASSTLRLNRFGARDVLLRFRCASAPSAQAKPQVITARINGAELTPVSVTHQYSVNELQVPVGMLRQGPNTIEWSYSSWGSPEGSNDTRPLAVAWDWIEFVEVGVTPSHPPTRAEGTTLVLSNRSGVQFESPLRPGMMFVIDQVEAQGVEEESLSKGAVRIELSWPEGAIDLELSPGDENVRIPLRVERPGTLRVRIFAPAIPAGEGDRVGWMIHNPRLIASDPC